MKKYYSIWVAVIVSFALATASCNREHAGFTPTLESQGIAMDSISNCRQLGGYPIGGKHIKQNALIRSANLSRATEADLTKLHDVYHTSMIFDFRSTPEHVGMPDREIKDCEYIWLPCLEQVSKIAPSKAAAPGSVGDMAEYIYKMLDNPDVREMATKMYPMIVFDADVQANYSRFLRELAMLPEGESALWHCSQGKDRTGWAAAFFLASLGAGPDLVIKDFALSNEIYKGLIDKLVQRAKDDGKDEESISMIYSLVGVNVELFEKTLGMIDERYGSLDAYLSSALGVDETLRGRLRQRYLE